MDFVGWHSFSLSLSLLLTFSRARSLSCWCPCQNKPCRPHPVIYYHPFLFLFAPHAGTRVQCTPDGPPCSRHASNAYYIWKKKYMHLYKGHICRYTVNIRFRLSYVCLCTPVLIYDAAINIEKIRCVCGRNDADPTPSIVFVCGWFDNIFHSNAVVAIAAVTNLGTTRFPLPIIIIRRWSIVWVEAFWLNSMLLPLLCLFLWTVCLFVCLLMFPILFLCFFLLGFSLRVATKTFHNICDLLFCWIEQSFE